MLSPDKATTGNKGIRNLQREVTLQKEKKKPSKGFVVEKATISYYNKKCSKKKGGKMRDNKNATDLLKELDWLLQKYNIMEVCN